jgi:hypothetical protein
MILILYWLKISSFCKDNSNIVKYYIGILQIAIEREETTSKNQIYIYMLKILQIL